MAKFVLTVSNVSSVEIEASSPDEAHAKLDKALNNGDLDITVQILEASSGWNITDIEEQ